MHGHLQTALPPGGEQGKEAPVPAGPWMDPKLGLCLVSHSHEGHHPGAWAVDAYKREA